jgi:hypothetical protein
MRSSDAGSRIVSWCRRSSIATSLGLTSVLVVACSTMPSSSQKPTAAPAADCITADAGTARPDAKMVAELRRSVEAGPLYAVASRSGGAACRISEESGAIRVEYTFRDGTTLRATRNAQIEYSDQEVRFASPPSESPVAVLTRTEQAAFDGKGCGIDWRRGDTRAASDDARARETIYRGETCNCQARVRNNSAGGVTGLLFRTAC